MGLSEESYRRALAVAPKISGSLSIVGSSFIIRDVYNRRLKRKRSTNNSSSNDGSHHQRPLQLQHDQHLPTTSRVILSMSLADIGSSFWAHFLGTWLVPADDDMAAFAAGNQGTCTAQSFLYELFVHAGLWFSAFLAVAYWLTICREKSETTLREWKWQTVLLGVPWMLGLLNSVPKIILGTAGYNGFWWCELVDGTPADNLLDQISLAVAFVLIVCSMLALIRFVYVQEKRMDRFGDELQQREKTTQVAYQGLFYIVAWLTIVLPTIPVTVTDDLPQGYLVFWACLFPLQGLANALVYFRPKYRATIRRERNSGQRGSTAMLSATAQVLDVKVPAPVKRLAGSALASVRRATDDSSGEVPFGEANRQARDLDELHMGNPGSTEC